MNPIGHVQFIQTPISIIIQDTNSACMSLGNGIELHPLASYIMQTTFLRMTGASEQKLKCLCWEIASLDYDFRYEILQNPLGECSNYNDKKNICKSVCKSLRRYDTDIKFSDDEKDRIINQATAELLTLLKSSPLSVIFEKEYIEFESYCASSPIKRASFCNLSKEGNLNFVEEDLKKYYEDFVYRQRNRYAHNLTSYQLNVPSFSQILKVENDKNNHFRMMSILILMDGIFMTLFEKFQVMKESHSYQLC